MSEQIALCPHCRQPMPRAATIAPTARGTAEPPLCEFRFCNRQASFLIGEKWLCAVHRP